MEKYPRTMSQPVLTTCMQYAVFLTLTLLEAENRAGKAMSFEARSHTAAIGHTRRRQTSKELAVQSGSGTPLDSRPIRTNTAELTDGQ
jgi:hypothetical protein